LSAVNCVQLSRLLKVSLENKLKLSDMEWIKKKDRLPLKCTDVLVTVFKKGVINNNILIAWFDGDNRFYETQIDDDISEIVTHWQPLPDPASQE
jgi:hypothetical protein